MSVVCGVSAARDLTTLPSLRSATDHGTGGPFNGMGPGVLLNHDGTAAQQPEPMTRRAARAAETSRREANPRKILTSGFATLRDLASYVLGAAIIVHEVWLTVHPDAYLVGVGVAFCGLPLVLGADEKRAK